MYLHTHFFEYVKYAKFFVFTYPKNGACKIFKEHNFANPHFWGRADFQYVTRIKKQNG